MNLESYLNEWGYVVFVSSCSWLQAAQNFRELQDKQEGDNLRESYRVNLGKFIIGKYVNTTIISPITSWWSHSFILNYQIWTMTVYNWGRYMQSLQISNISLFSLILWLHKPLIQERRCDLDSLRDPHLRSKHKLKVKVLCCYANRVNHIECQLVFCAKHIHILMRDIFLLLARVVGRTERSPHVRESETIFDSGFQSLGSRFLSLELGFRIPVVDSGFLKLHSGFQSPGFQISKAKIPFHKARQSFFFSCVSSLLR